MKKGYKIIIFVLVVVILAVLGFNVYLKLFPNISFTAASEGGIEETVSAEALVIRDEEVVLKESDAIVGSVVVDGERVSKGQKLADLYYGEVTPELQAEVREVNEKLAALDSLAKEKSQDSASSLDSMMKTYAEDIIDYAHKENCTGLYKTDTNIDGVMNRKIVSDDQNYDATVAKLTERKKQLETEMSGDKKDIVSPVSGLYFSSFDGYEGMIGSDSIADLNPRTLQQILSKKKNAGNYSATMKVVSGFHWYVALPLSEGKLPTVQKKKQQGIPVKVRFNQFGNDTYEVDIVGISDVQDGQAVVTLRGSSFADAVYYNRILGTELILNEYNGIKFLNDAIQTVNNKTGVYVADNNGIAKFKEVSVLATDNGYTVVSIDSGNKNALQLYDDIIISKAQIYNGEVVR